MAPSAHMYSRWISEVTDGLGPPPSHEPSRELESMSYEIPCLLSVRLTDFIGI